MDCCEVMLKQAGLAGSARTQFEFCHNLGFWVLPLLKYLRLVAIRVLKFSQFVFIVNKVVVKNF